MSIVWFMNVVLMTTINSAPAANDCGELPGDERARLVALLVDTAKDDDLRSVGIHAAEALASLGQPKPIVEAFRRQVNSTEPGYRVGVWRVLARVEVDGSRQQYTERIRRVLLDPQAPDLVHAMEALAKLGTPIRDAAERCLVREMADSTTDSGSPFALWRMAQADERGPAIGRLLKLSTSNDRVTRLRALYVLARLRPLPEAIQKSLLDALKFEPDDSEFRPALACVVGGAEVARLAEVSQSAADRYRAAMQLAEEPCDDNGPLLWSLVDDADADVRVAAAFAILRSSKAQPRP